MLSSFKKFDIFTKVDESSESRTTHGGIVSIAVTLAIFFAFFLELSEYLKYQERHEFTVDDIRQHRLNINFDITVNAECSSLRIDLVDVSGKSNVKSNVIKENSLFNIDKARLLSDKKKPKTEIDHVHDIIKLSAKKRKFKSSSVLRFKDPSKVGCRFYGTLSTNKVKGSLRITNGNNFLRQVFRGAGNGNFTHVIDELSFGNFYPSLINPLDETFQVSENESTTFQYFVSIIPTVYTGTNGKTLVTSQYAVNQVALDADSVDSVPGIFFTYDIEPILVNITELRIPFSKFLIRICSMIGGIFVSVGLLLKLVDHSSTSLAGKKHNREYSTGILDTQNSFKANNFESKSF
ncbi:hypothetical protein BB559_001080 [Furculomyces boomerangus]|uniref:Endoplasmic reticulum vesicle transporter C-terminal domain-containing protein n=2 Tax=Harpellales TaxID=61421 RepID=A0A2T9Z347_9FUNG|nr:hypothetical protein BB559_001080 [Furculomyces boomerangus]PWA03778.1 hypothetical protein BB558_000032 [Smittium angustum]